MSLYHEQLRKLNTRQLDALSTKGNTVVIAGPGSGKSTVLSLKVAKLLRNEIVMPQGVACLTYTRVMAHAIEKKVQSLIDVDWPHLVADTIHGFCLGQIITPFSKLFGLDIPEPIRVAPLLIWEECLDESRQTVEGKPYHPEDDRSFKTELIKYYLQRVDVPFDEWENQIYARLIEHHVMLLKSRGYIDFNLIIKYGLELIANKPLVRSCLEAKFPWFAIDEYQDLGYPLFRIVTELLDKTTIRVFAIGDPDQAIYGFLGTDPKYLHDLAEREDVQDVVYLDTNYRSTQDIVDICTRIIQPTCTYRADNQTGVGVCCRMYRASSLSNLDTILRALINKYADEYDIPFHKIVVLHPWRLSNSTGEGITRIAQSLEEKGVSYDLDRHPLYERKNRLIHWLEEIAVWCLTGWTPSPSLKVHSANFNEIQAFWETLNSSLLNTLRHDSDFRLTLTAILWEIRGRNMLLRDWIAHLRKQLNLDEVLTLYKREFPDEVQEFENLIDLTAVDASLGDWRIDKFAHMQSAAQLTTLHSSKGLEYDVVIIVGVEHIWDDAEGQRLFYVGATRAKQQVAFIYRQKEYEGRLYTPAHINRLIEKCDELQYFSHFTV